MTMEDVARYYIEELIDRSLVEAMRRERGKVISCKIHDLVRDMAIKKAKELNFVHVHNEKQSATSCRREVFHHHMYTYSSERPANKRMRSFLFFGERNGTLWSYVKTITLKLKLLRVLNLGGVRFDSERYINRNLPDVIGELFHLRYLGVAYTFISNLPASISNLRFLQTLDASGNVSFRKVIDLRKLTSLRHLMGRFVGDMLIAEALNLQTLRSISSYSWSKLKHELLVNLRDLEIYDSMWVDQVSVILDLVSFSKLKNLRVLTLKVPTFKLSWEEDVQFRNLVELTLRCDIKRLPKEMDLLFPSLESVCLVGLHLEEDPMLALKNLQRLENVVLDSCDYSGEKMRISEHGFGRLRELVFYIDGLDELQIEEKAMPSLMKLKLRTRGRQTKLLIPARLREFFEPLYTRS